MLNASNLTEQYDKKEITKKEFDKWDKSVGDKGNWRCFDFCRKLYNKCVPKAHIYGYGTHSENITEIDGVYYFVWRRYPSCD